MIPVLWIAMLWSVAAFGQSDAAWIETPIVRLRPSAFPQLPAAIQAELQRRGCGIPQTPMIRKRHNVIRGQFARPGQWDWAVLCSRRGVSSILVFWNESPGKPAVLAPAEDDRFRQGMEAGQFVFSRAIAVATKTWILTHYRAYGGPKPPRLDHQGIDDAFVGKGSSVHYFHRGKWICLAGAD